MSELRWILLLIGMTFLVGLAAWETRRARHARSDSAATRTSGFADPPRTDGVYPESARAEGARTDGTRVSPAGHVRRSHREPQLGDLPVPPGADEAGEPEEFSATDAAFESLEPAESVEAVEPLEPLEPLAAEIDEIADEGVPRAAQSEPEPEPERLAAADPPTADSATNGAATPTVEGSSASPPLVVDWPPEGARQIISVRIVGTSEQCLSGRATRQALAACGFLHGRYRIFHQPSSDGRALLSCASLSKPGNFDPASMDFQRFSGLSLFTVLPGPLPASAAVDRLLDTARDLTQRLQARLQDDQGQTLDAAAVAALRNSAHEQGGRARTGPRA